MSLGAAAEATDSERDSPTRATELTTRSRRFLSTSSELENCARLWRQDSLD
jgi:hypothetical protein